jgi:hypothetical protein
VTRLLFQHRPFRYHAYETGNLYFPTEIFRRSRSLLKHFSLFLDRAIEILLELGERNVAGQPYAHFDRSRENAEQECNSLDCKFRCERNGINNSYRNWDLHYGDAIDIISLILFAIFYKNISVQLVTS